MIETLQAIFFEIWLIIFFLAVVAFEIFWRTAIFVIFLGLIWWLSPNASK